MFLRSSPIPNERNRNPPRLEPSPVQQALSTQHMPLTRSQALIQVPHSTTHSNTKMPWQQFKLRLTSLNSLLTNMNIAPTARNGPTAVLPHNKQQFRNVACVNSPCPRKETGQSPGLPNCKGEMAKENKRLRPLQRKVKEKTRCPR